MRFIQTGLLLGIGLSFMAVAAHAQETAIKSWGDIQAEQDEQEKDTRAVYGAKLARLAEPELELMQSHMHTIMNVAEPMLKPVYQANPGREAEIRTIYAKNTQETMSRYIQILRKVMPKVLSGAYNATELQRLTAYYQEPLVQEKMAIIRQTRKQIGAIAQQCLKQGGMPTSSGSMNQLQNCGHQQLQPILQKQMGKDFTALQDLETEKYVDIADLRSLSRATARIYQLMATPEMSAFLLKLMKESQNNLQQDFLAADIHIPSMVAAPATPNPQAFQ